MQSKILAQALIDAFCLSTIIHIVDVPFGKLILEKQNYILKHPTNSSCAIIAANELKSIKDLQSWIDHWSKWLKEYG